MSDLYLLRGHVYHSRSETARNSFSYPVLNVYFPVQQEQRLAQLLKDRFYNLLSVDPRHYLSQSQSSLAGEIKELVKNKFNYEGGQVFLQTIPKMFGYVFNPVSFWYFFRENSLDAVLCEVNNTFGEKHYYWLCESGADLNNKWLLAKKEFHVSPFFDLQGYYKFKFVFKEQKIESHIQFINADHSLRLITWIKGDLTKLEEASLLKIIFSYGWMTPLVVFRIHYQAVKLYFKKVRFFSKPQLPEKDVTHGTSLTGR